MQKVFCAAILAFAKAGNSMAARMAMMAMTTNSSIKVNPFFRFGFSNAVILMAVSYLS
jgi:uncharacterized membrane protein